MVLSHSFSTFVLLLLLAAGRCDSGFDDVELILSRAILIEPNYTGLDCFFNKNEECYWTWDTDNYTLGDSEQQHKPGQNGFIRLTSEEIRSYYHKWPKQFFGPYGDSRNYTGKLHVCKYLNLLVIAQVICYCKKRRKCLAQI